VSEAFNPQEECYGNDRLLADVATFAGQAATAVTEQLLQRVRFFAGTAPQSDDIAILTLKVQTGIAGLTVRRMLELRATPEEVMRGVEELNKFAAAQGVPETICFSLALALEECASNIVNHALQRDAQRQFQVGFEKRADSFVLEFRDEGAEFDPTAAAPRKAQAEDDDLPGGWGIELVRRQIDEVRYRREAGQNVLRLRKRLVPEGRDK
jgi:phosphoserine phosphatase RsbU/P